MSGIWMFGFWWPVPREDQEPCRMCRVRVIFGRPMAHFCCRRAVSK